METPFADLSRDQLEAEITALAGHLNAATYRWLTLIAEFDRRFGWNDGCLRSCAHWLNFKVGLNLGAAREKVRVAHALTEVPKIAAAMARGEISYSKVRALTRVATPATEDALLMIAHHGTAHHVETTVRYFRQAQNAEALSREQQQQVTRSVQYWYDDDGSLIFKARLPALAGAMLVKAIECAMNDVPPTAVTEPDGEQPLSYQERRADAFAVVAESFVRAVQHDAAPPGHGAADAYQVIIHVDADSLRDHAAGRCHVENGTSLPVETVRRLTCDSSLVRIVETEAGEPLDVGRKTRTIPPAIRRALNARDQGCCFPGCTFNQFVDAHHLEHWADGGETKLSNLVSLCRWHHRLVHEGRISVEAVETVETVGRRDWRFRRPDGREFARVGRPDCDTDWNRLCLSNAELGIEIDSDTAACRWNGGKMDYELGVWVLCNQVQRANDGLENVSAETFDSEDTFDPKDPRPDRPGGIRTTEGP